MAVSFSSVVYRVRVERKLASNGQLMKADASHLQVDSFFGGVDKLKIYTYL